MPGARKGSKRPVKRRWKTSRILTWVGFACLAAALAVLAFFALAGGGERPRRSVRQAPVVSTERQISVDVVDNDYEPRDLTVNRGAEVTWRFKGDIPHSVTDDRGRFNSGVMESGAEFAITFDEAGTYYYYCTLHHGMQGTLAVLP
jgi:plastocyanin